MPMPNIEAHPGYGPRDPDEDRAPRREIESGRVRARVWIGLGASAFGWGTPVLFVLAALRENRLTPPQFYASAAFYALLGLPFLLAGAWFLAVPILSWDAEGLVLRHRPFRAPLRWSPAEIEWRPRAPYVGRYLLARHGGPKARFPLWMIPRSAARRLFAYLDEACAGVEGGARPLGRP